MAAEWRLKCCSIPKRKESKKMITINLRLDVFRENNIPIFRVPRGDGRGRNIRATITALGDRVNVDPACTASISAKLPTGVTKTLTGTVNSDGTVTVPTDGAMFAAEGEVKCTITVARGDYKYTTNEFFINVVE